MTLTNLSGRPPAAADGPTGGFLGKEKTWKGEGRGERRRERGGELDALVGEVYGCLDHLDSLVAVAGGKMARRCCIARTTQGKAMGNFL